MKQPQTVKKLVLLRHGESEWNKENRFTGWTDVNLTMTGVKEATAAGKILKEQGFQFDIAYASVLKRAIYTLWEVMRAIDQPWLPVEKSWKLNERHYGALQGKNKKETADKYGEAQVTLWRRSYDIAPPALARDVSEFYTDSRYQALGATAESLPIGESLLTTVERVVPYWENVIKPTIAQGKKVIITAHGNSLRALIKHISDVSNEDILKLNIPTAVPLVYEFDSHIKPVKAFYYLGDADSIAKKVDAVANQAKKAN